MRNFSKIDAIYKAVLSPAPPRRALPRQHKKRRLSEKIAKPPCCLFQQIHQIFFILFVRAVGLLVFLDDLYKRVDVRTEIVPIKLRAVVIAHMVMHYIVCMSDF